MKKILLLVPVLALGIGMGSEAQVHALERAPRPSTNLMAPARSDGDPSAQFTPLAVFVVAATLMYTVVASSGDATAGSPGLKVNSDPLFDE